MKEEEKRRSREASARYRAKHPNKIAEYSRRYREKNPEAAAAAARKYRETHREELRERRRKRYRKDIHASRKANREKARKWRAQVQGGFHRYHLNRYYGPGAAGHYAEQMEKQQGRCAVCGRTPNGKLHLDHDHKTKRFRGLLCGECNRALGLCGENVDIIRRLAAYIEQWGIKPAA